MQDTIEIASRHYGPGIISRSTPCQHLLRTGRDDLECDQIWRSSDGGISWRKVFEYYDETGMNISAADARHVMAAGGPKIFGTTDTGSTRERIPAPYADYDYLIDPVLIDVAYPADTVAYVLGARAKLAWHGTTILAPPTVIRPRQRDELVTTPAEIRWHPVKGAVAYDIQIGDTTNEAPWYFDRSIYHDLVINDSLITDTSYVASLAPDRKYRCPVRARGVSEMSDWSHDQDFLTLSVEGGEIYPIVTSPKSGTMYLPTTVEIRWDSLQGFDRYDLQLSNTWSFDYGSRDTILAERRGITGSSIILSGLTPNRWYFVRMRGISGDYVGPWSTHVTVDFKTDGPSAVVGDRDHALPHRLLLEPNPSHGTANVELLLNVSRGGDASISIVDLLGREIRHVSSGMLQPGTHRIPVNVTGLSRGFYLITVRTGDGVESHQIVID